MNETALTAMLERPEVIRTGREMSLSDLSRQSMNIDQTRPPEPGSFRFSLEAMQRSSAKILRRPSPGRSHRASAHGHDDAASRRPERQTSVRENSGRGRRESAKARVSRRSDETRKREPAQRTERQQKPARPENAEKLKDQASRDSEPSEKDTPVVSDTGDNPEKEVVATTNVPIEETPAKAAGNLSKTVSPAVSTPQVLPEDAAGGGKTVLPGETRKQGKQLADTVSGDAAKTKSGIAPERHKVSGKLAKGAGKPAAPLPADTAEGNSLAGTQPKQSAVLAARGAAPDNALGQATLQPPPVVGSQETAALSARTGGEVAAALEEESAGRVAQIRSDNQSGQTGLFPGTHSPPGTIQGGGAAAAPDAPTHPFQQDLLQQVTEKTVFFLKNGKSQARIDLKPELLGHMRLHVSTENGQVTLKIMTESAWARDIIESNINHLKNELQNHNLQIDRLDVSVSGGSQDFSGGDSQAANSRHASSGSALTGEDEAVTLPDDEATRRPLVEGQRVGLVDYFA